MAVTPTVPILLGRTMLNPLPLIITESKRLGVIRFISKRFRQEERFQKIKYLSDSEPYASIPTILWFLPISTYSSKYFGNSGEKDELPT